MNNNLVRGILSRWAELPVIPEGMTYPVLDRSGERIVDAGGTVRQPAFGFVVEGYLAEGLSLIRAAFEVIELNLPPMVLFEEDPVPLPDGLDDRPRFKVRLHARFGLESPYRIVKTGVVGWQRQHVVAYMNGEVNR